MRKRIEYIDLAKAIAILLMVLGHCASLNDIPLIRSVIYSFHMPLFFIISGYFFKTLALKEGVIKYSRTYLLLTMSRLW